MLRATVAGDAVTAAAHGDAGIVRQCESHCLLYISHVVAFHDQMWPLVDGGIPAVTFAVVGGRTWRVQSAAQRSPQDLDSCGRESEVAEQTKSQQVDAKRDEEVRMLGAARRLRRGGR